MEGEDSRKTCWIQWSRLCLPKKMGGLGIRNMEVFNVSLLENWKWGLLQDSNYLWADLLQCTRFGGKTCKAWRFIYLLPKIGSLMRLSTNSETILKFV